MLAAAAGFVAVLASSLFAGAAIYINLVEHPARLSCGTELAVAEWVPSYKRATAMQASLAVLATLAALLRWFVAGGWWWLWGALLMLAIVPFTLIVIFPTNRKLLNPQRDRTSNETRALLIRWARLHAVRSVLSLAATLIFLWPSSA